MADPRNPIVWLTSDAFTKLSEELEHLKGDGRRRISAKIGQARDEGDLSENGGYHAAREEQGQQEARIRQLEAMLRDAHIGEPPADISTVEPGVRVTISYGGDTDDTDTFLLGSRELMGLTDDTDIEVFSPQSPLGAAILGQKKGDRVTYTGPGGKEFEVTIGDIAPYSA